ncbi:MAG: PAS domain S-box protein [Ignavibacteriales bacterium]|nr:PAS domain S-box protein [Ignavibacteriales bacterium]
MESTKPEFPGVLSLGVGIPMEKEGAETFRILLETDGPVKFGQSTGLPLPANTAKRFNIQSFMAMAFHLKVSQPWQFGVQQCSYARDWTHDEERLFKEIGRRLADALTSLLTLRNLQEKEARLEEAQRVAHVGYWDRDFENNRVILSDETLRILGLEQGENIQNPIQLHKLWLKMIHPADRLKVSETTTEIQQCKLHYNVDYRLVLPTGEVRFVHTEVDLTREISGKLSRWFGMIQDITERKLSEKALLTAKAKVEENERKINAIANQATEGISLADSEGNFVFINPAFCKMTGYSETELLKMSVCDIKSRIQPAASFAENSITKLGMPLQVQLRCKDGSEFAAEIISSIVKIDNVDFVLRTVRDITERLRIEESLKKSEERYRLIANNTADTIASFDLNLQYTYISPSVRKLLGYTPEELMGIGLQKIVSEKSWLSMQQILSEELEWEKHNKTDPKRSRIITTEQICKDGRIIWVEGTVSFVRDENGTPLSILAISRDITERKTAEMELRKLSRTVVQSPVSIIITDIEGTIEYVNPKFCTITGYSLEEAKNQNSRILKSGEQPREFYRNMWDTILAGKTWEGELHNKKKNGELFWEKVLITPIMNQGGVISNFVAIKEDITEKKKMIDELIKAKELAEQSNKLKDAFIANISHEIRTPLNGLLGMVSIIKQLYASSVPEEEEIYFLSIDKSSKRLIRTVDMILNYSRFQVGEFSMHFKSVDLEVVCKNFLEEYEAAAKANSLFLSFTNSCGQALVSADQFSITQAISNIIDNAIKYTEEGFVKLELKKSENDEILLIVSDSGIGIDEEYLNHIFEPYGQEYVGYSRAYEGVGLGLALTKKILDEHKAVITVKSKKGAGSVFTINFGENRLIDADETVQMNNKIKEFEPEKHKTRVVVIVEDDPINQNLIHHFINREYNTLITDSHKGLLEILENNNVDLILMDISLKGTENGLEIVKQLKASPKYANIPVIAETAHAFDSDRENAFNAGCDGYIAKPFSMEELLKKIGEHIK